MFSVFKGEDKLGRAREQNLVQTLARKRKQKLSHILGALALYRDKRQDKRMKIGMAEILRRRSLELKHFDAFREVTFALRDKH